MKSIIIRADASEKIGIGHVMRSLALGQMAQDEGYNVIFMTKSKNDYLISRLVKENFKIIRVSEDISIDEDANHVVAVAKDENADWIIADGYHFTTDYQRIIKESNLMLINIDDIAEGHFLSDVIVNQNINSEKIFNYSCEPYTRLFMGTKHLILRREYRELMNWERECHSECKHILITVGGADPKNITNRILRSLIMLGLKNIKIKIILGVNYQFFDEIEEIKRGIQFNCEFIRNCENLVPYIKWSDLAITAAGSTVWELLLCQTPLIIFSFAENQKFVVKELTRLNLAQHIYDIENKDLYSIANQINEVINNSTMRFTLFKNSLFFRNQYMSMLNIKEITRSYSAAP